MEIGNAAFPMAAFDVECKCMSSHVWDMCIYICVCIFIFVLIYVECLEAFKSARKWLCNCLGKMCHSLSVGIISP